MGNFSRNTFNPQKRYVSVRLQQGVPLVDADWNELSDVTRHEAYLGLDLAAADGLTAENDFRFLSGGPNNPVIGGGAGMVNGRTFRTSTIAYDTQPWRDPARAAADGVPPIPALTTPTANRTDICYLDVWEREVGQGEDANIVNPAIGVETSVRLQRDVALRVAEGTSTLPAEPAGHSHLPIAFFHRLPGVDTVNQFQREDLRRFLNVVALAPVFATIRQVPAWSLVFQIPDGKHIASNLGVGAQGIAPLALPSGVRMRQVRIGGRTSSGQVDIRLLRYRQNTVATPQVEALASLTITGAPGLVNEQFDRTFPVPSDGRELVDNGRFSYAFEVTGSSQPTEVHGISMIYSYSGAP